MQKRRLQTNVKTTTNTNNGSDNNEYAESASRSHAPHIVASDALDALAHHQYSGTAQSLYNAGINKHTFCDIMGYDIGDNTSNNGRNTAFQDSTKDSGHDMEYVDDLRHVYGSRGLNTPINVNYQ